jgi:hypothetical protein
VNTTELLYNSEGFIVHKHQARPEVVDGDKKHQLTAVNYSSKKIYRDGDSIEEI